VIILGIFWMSAGIVLILLGLGILGSTASTESQILTYMVIALGVMPFIITLESIDENLKELRKYMKKEKDEEENQPKK